MAVATGTFNENQREPSVFYELPGTITHPVDPVMDASLLLEIPKALSGYLRSV
jgi:hypothetical protein